MYSSSKWKLISSSRRKELNPETKDDGEFWMSYDDMTKHFTDMEICSVSMDKLYEDDSGECGAQYDVITNPRLEFAFLLLFPLIVQF